MDNAISPHLGGRKMSSSLKEKLKRLHRLSFSPVSSSVQKVSIKGTKINTSESESLNRQLDFKKSTKSENIKDTEMPSNKQEHFENDITKNENSNKNEILLELKQLKAVISEKEEILRKLNMVKTYHSKNNLTKLTELIEKWRGVAQDSLKELHNRIPEPKGNLSKLIHNLQIDPKLINYNSDDDDFIEY